MAETPVHAPLRIPDTSAIISLSRIGRLHLLSELEQRILVPDSVIRELHGGPRDNPGHRWAESLPSDSREDDSRIDPRILAWRLGPGESQVLQIAFEYHSAGISCEAVIDESAGRKCARELGLRLRGTIGLLVLGRKHGLTPSLRSDLGRLREVGFHLDDSLAKRALILAGED